MRKLIVAAGLLVFAGTLPAQGKLMHCFAFTVIEGASAADWKAFENATDALPGKIPGLTRVWHGKLRRPLAINTVDSATSKKLSAGEKDVSGTVNRVQRQHGVCMEMADEAALQVYEKHPFHADWVKAYSKVRVEGTTTFDIIGK